MRKTLIVALDAFNHLSLVSGKQRRLDGHAPTSEPLQWETETNILPPRRRKVKKVRVKKEKVVKEVKEKEEKNRSWGGPVLALPLIAPRPDDSFSDAFRDVEGKLGLPSISKKAEFSAAITTAPATPPRSRPASAPTVSLSLFIFSHFSMTEYLSPERALSVRECVSVSVCSAL